MPHLHLDICLITEDNRLSSKALITREFIQSMHDKLPIVLQAHGFDVQRGEHGHEGGLSAIEYKKQMENEAREISNKIDDMIKEHNSSNSIIGNNYENGIVNINTATIEELQTLPGIGPSTAAKIIEYRNQYGSFRKTEDLLNISGIGEKTLEKFQNRLCV